MTSPIPVPEAVRLLTKSRVLELQYAAGEVYRLDFEYLRVYTPSAEARGHAPGQEVLQTGKRNVELLVTFGFTRQAQLHRLQGGSRRGNDRDIQADLPAVGGRNDERPFEPDKSPVGKFRIIRRCELPDILLAEVAQ